MKHVTRLALYQSNTKGATTHFDKPTERSEGVMKKVHGPKRSLTIQLCYVKLIYTPSSLILIAMNFYGIVKHACASKRDRWTSQGIPWSNGTAGWDGMDNLQHFWTALGFVEKFTGGCHLMKEPDGQGRSTYTSAKHPGFMWHTCITPPNEAAEMGGRAYLLNTIGEGSGMEGEGGGHSNSKVMYFDLI